MIGVKEKTPVISNDVLAQHFQFVFIVRANLYPQQYRGARFMCNRPPGHLPRRPK
jgi:hypothetical protein